jgi:serine/threonine protein phosphatase PrpC
VALTEGVLATNQELFGSGIDIQFSGTTYVSVLVRGDLLLASNVGDSRAVLGHLEGDNWSAVALT